MNGDSYASRGIRGPPPFLFCSFGLLTFSSPLLKTDAVVESILFVNPPPPPPRACLSGLNHTDVPNSLDSSVTTGVIVPETATATARGTARGIVTVTATVTANAIGTANANASANANAKEGLNGDVPARRTLADFDAARVMLMLTRPAEATGTASARTDTLVVTAVETVSGTAIGACPVVMSGAMMTRGLLGETETPTMTVAGEARATDATKARLADLNPAAVSVR